MTIYLRQATASQEVPLGFFIDSTDGNTEETALTINNTDIKVWKTGATTLANKNSGGGTHISNGIYYAVLDATDTDTIGPIVLFVHVTGALAVRLECVVLDEAVYDALFGTTALATGAIPTAAAIADAVWDEGTAGHVAAGSEGKAIVDVLAFGAPPAVSAIADGVWDEQLAGHVAAGSAGLAEGNLDATVSSRLAAGGYTAPDNATIAVISAAVTALNDLTSAEVGDAVLDEVVEGGHTLRELTRLFASALAGKVAGAGTGTITFRDIDDTKNRIVATVDGTGNRNAVVLNEA